MHHQEILKKIQTKSIDQAEVFLSSAKSLKIDVLDGQVEATEEVRDAGCGVRIIKNKKLGFAYTSDFDEDVLEETIEQAIANAKNSEADKNHNLPLHLPISPSLHLELVDPQITTTPIQEKIKLALEIENQAYKKDPRVKKTEKVSYSDSETEVWLANSNGVNVNYKSNSCGAMAQMISVQNGAMEYGCGLSFVKKFDDLDPKEIGQEAAQRACQLLGAKTIPSQKMPIVLDPTVGIDLLGVLLSPLTAEAVQKGKSLFANKLGQAVGSNVLTIIDNGQLPNAIGSAPFDDEGVPTQETILIEDGKLKNYLYNTYTANKGKTKSTGNASRGSFTGLPITGPTNFYIEAGKQPQAALLKSIEKGLYILRVMGIHTANPISGEFSVGASGIMIENGQLTYPVRGVTISGNLINMLERIEEVGDDLRFIGNVGAPTLLISGVSIGGN
ncbi:TldD/PmbA family protein [Candidatus Margulisiibacteriota bacterium]